MLDRNKTYTFEGKSKILLKMFIQNFGKELLVYLNRNIFLKLYIIFKKIVSYKIYKIRKLQFVFDTVFTVLSILISYSKSFSK